MNLSATLILAFGMSMDAFAASIGKGATLHKPLFREALRTGLIFGGIEAVTPLIGWSLGLMASQYLLEWDHWVAFTLLGCLGARMVIGGLRQQADSVPRPGQHSLRVLVATAIATSLDAMAVGVGLAFLEVNILHTAMIIGMATMIMTTMGMLLGRFIGPLLGKKAEIIGGAILIGIGCNILYSHFGRAVLPGL
ncbi:manganese efflux pump MntP [Acerihabitans arboris]|uniref:Putative manganese efflux pump MntP n=1 Tax=Acerihabitans arboris TaxID=2691583 RepID=A0A845SGI9_9GAMM|nr:manganese efflux pump MntP [Acerihabitans arboris]NDL62502.1 manganese efflux pump MntP [Acerihabitans arboris]